MLHLYCSRKTSGALKGYGVEVCTENTLHYNIYKLSLLNNSLVYRGLHVVITVSLVLIAPAILYSETAAYKSRFLYFPEQKQLKRFTSISNFISFPNAYQDLAIDLCISAVSKLGTSAHNLYLQYSTEMVRAIFGYQ